MVLLFTFGPRISIYRLPVEGNQTFFAPIGSSSCPNASIVAYLVMRRFDHRLLGAKEVQLKRDPRPALLRRFFRSSRKPSVRKRPHTREHMMQASIPEPET